MPAIDRPQRREQEMANPWAWIFWILLILVGASLLQISAVRVRVAAASLAPMDWSLTRLTGLLVWSALCLLGALAESRYAQPFARTWADPRRRVRACWPVAGLCAIAAAQTYLGFYHFCQLPAAIALTGWLVGGLAAVAPPISLGANLRHLAVTMVLILAGAVGAFWFTSLQRLHAQGHMGYPDVGIFASRLINTARGVMPFQENAQSTPFWDHFNPGLYLLTPLVNLFNAIGVLHLAGSLAVVLPAPIWYLMIRRKGGSVGAAFLAACGWLVLPGLGHALFAMSLGVHALILALPFLALSLLLLGERRWIAFAVAAVIACAFRETIALSFAGVGLWLLSVRSRRRSGGIVLLAALAYLLVTASLVIPHFRAGADYLGIERFSHLGDSTWHIILSPILQPTAFWGTLFSASSITFLLVILSCVGFLPIRTGRQLLILLPECMLLLLWDEPLARSIAYHYQAPLTVLIYWVTLQSVMAKGIPDPLNGARRRRAWGTLVGSAASAACLLGWWPSLHATTPFEVLPSRAPVMNWIRERVQPDDTVAATRRAANHCLQAANLSILPELDTPMTNWPDVFVLDYADDWGRVNLPQFLPALRQWHRRLQSGPYIIDSTREAVAIYRRSDSTAPPAPPLFELPWNDPLAQQPAAIIPQLSLLAWRLIQPPLDTKTAEGTFIAVQAAFQVAATPTIDLGLALAVQLKSHPNINVVYSYVRPAGGMSGTSRDWVPGQVIIEQAAMPWPAQQVPPRADLRLAVELFDLSTGRRIATKVSH